MSFESLPSTIQGYIFNFLEWKNYKSIPIVCKKFLHSVEKNWKARFVVDFGEKRAKYVIGEKWKLECLTLHRVKIQEKSLLFSNELNYQKDA